MFHHHRYRHSHSDTTGTIKCNNVLLRKVFLVVLAVTVYLNLLFVMETKEEEKPSTMSSSSSSTSPPRVFLHIGPHKSGTTTIQCVLQEYSSPLRDLDSVVFLGKVDFNFCNFPRNNNKDPDDDRIRKLDKCIQDEACWERLLQEWDRNRKNRLDMILSKESLSDWSSTKHSDASFRSFFWNELAKAFVHWDVTIVLTYRHYFDWLPSAHSQHWYHTQVQSNHPWTNITTPASLRHLLGDILEKDVGPPYPFLDDILNNKNIIFPSNWDIQILNLHNQQQDFVSALLCNVLEAKHTCQLYQQTPPKRTSPSIAVQYDQINLEANRLGWSAGGRRFARMKTTRQFVQRNQNAINLDQYLTDCPRQGLLQKFLDRSKELEIEILNKLSPDHENRFWNRTYCNLNATQALLSDSQLWKPFFQSL